MLVSVIVPIYKVEKYLNKCVDSIMKQTYKNLEIILVDDGSPDNCGKICDEYAQADERIKVIHKENGGLSDARNEGIKIANGDYIMFVDSDDYLSLDCVEHLYHTSIEHNADLVIGSNKKFDDESGEIIWNTADSENKIEIMNRTDAMKDMFMNGCSAWARLYKASVHKDIFFPYGEINEDEAIVLKILERCNTVVKTNKVIYNYRWRAESITSASFSPKKLVWCKHCRDNYDFIKQNYPHLVYYAKLRYVESLKWLLTLMAYDFKENKVHIVKLRKEFKANIHFYLKSQVSLVNKINGILIANAYRIFCISLKVFNRNYR